MDHDSGLDQGVTSENDNENHIIELLDSGYVGSKLRM